MLDDGLDPPVTDVPLTCVDVIVLLEDRALTIANADG